jgi:hypothetical protein
VLTTDFCSSRARHYAITTLLVGLAGFQPQLVEPGRPAGVDAVRRAAPVGSAGRRLVGLSRFELLTPRLSSVCSNQLSYRPQVNLLEPLSKIPAPPGSFKTR